MVRRTVEPSSGQYVSLDCSSGCSENSTAYLVSWRRPVVRAFDFERGSKRGSNEGVLARERYHFKSKAVRRERKAQTPSLFPLAFLLIRWHLQSKPIHQRNCPGTTFVQGSFGTIKRKGSSLLAASMSILLFLATTHKWQANWKRQVDTSLCPS